MRTRNVSILSFAAVMGIMLFNFQNCAPAITNAVQGKDPTDAEVRIIDDWNKSEIQFVQDSVQVHDEAVAAGVGGLCNRQHNGAKLKWALWTDSDSNRPLMAGDSSCQS